MRTLAEARFDFDRRLLEAGIDHEQIAQVNVDLLDDARHVEVSCLTREDRLFAVQFELPCAIDPEIFDHNAIADAFIGAFSCTGPH